MHISEEVGLLHNSCTLHSEEVGVQCGVGGLRPLAPEQLMMGTEQGQQDSALHRGLNTADDVIGSDRSSYSDDALPLTRTTNFSDFEQLC